MELHFANNYGGEILNLKIVHNFKDHLGIEVHISGFIESNTQKTLYLESQHAVAGFDTFTIKLPQKIIPSFNSKHFTVWYEWTVTVIYDMHLDVYKTPFEIYNSNIETYSYSGLVRVADVNISNEMYRHRKKMALDRIYSKLFGAVLRPDAVSNDCELNYKKCSELRACEVIKDLSIVNEYKQLLETYKSIKSLSDDKASVEGDDKASIEGDSRIQNFRPIFSNPNICIITKRTTKVTVTNMGNKIATVEYPVYFIGEKSMKIRFFENIKSTTVYINKMEYENEHLIDMNIVFFSDFSTDNCIEKIVDLKISDYTFKTFCFEIKLKMYLVFDGFEVSFDIAVAGPYLRYRIIDD